MLAYCKVSHLKEFILKLNGLGHHGLFLKLIYLDLIDL